MKTMVQIRIRLKHAYRAFCSSLFYWLFEQSYSQYRSISFDRLVRLNELRKKLVQKRSELASIKMKQRDYNRLRVLAKAAFSHGEHVRYIDRLTVKLRLKKQFHDEILKVIERIEDREP